MAKQQKTLDLLSHCQSCTSSCCKHDRFIVTPQEHDAIIASGAPDHCVRVDIPQGTFYVLDYKSGACAYLDDKKKCTIQSEKPGVCRTFPRQAMNGIVRNAPWCPIISENRLKGDKLFEEFLANASKDVEKRLSIITKDVYFDVFDAYDNRFNKHDLTQRKATIAYPQTS